MLEVSASIAYTTDTFGQVADSDETFVVLWHEGWGDVKAEAFDDLDEANERFDMLDGGAYATILVNGRFNELRYYGTRGMIPPS